MDVEAVEAKLAKVGKKHPVVEPDATAFVAEIQRLVERVDRLEVQVQESAKGLASVAGERDRYRAEASTMRAAALQFQATSHEAAVALRAALASLEDAQAQSLGAILAPGSPHDLGVE